MDLTVMTEPPALYAGLATAAVVLALIAWGLITSARARRERAELRARESEHEMLTLRDLDDADLDLVRRSMAAAQFRFVEDPADALLRVERVMTEVLRAKGYPVAEDRRQAARLFSIEHPDRAGSVRDVFDDGGSDDVADLRTQFLEARKTIADITGTTYGLDDAAAAPAGDLRVEHAPDAELAQGTSPS